MNNYTWDQDVRENGRNPHRKNRGWKDGQRIQWSEEFISGKPHNSLFPKTGNFQSWSDVGALLLVLLCLSGFVSIPYCLYTWVNSPHGISDAEYHELRRESYLQERYDAQQEAIDQYRAQEGI